MAKLTAAQRAALRPNQYVFPKTRKYPIPDKGHAQYAIRIGNIQYAKGNLSTAQYNQIVKKVNAKFGFKAKLKTNSSLRKTRAIKPK
jgi:hypothetical protein